MIIPYYFKATSVVTFSADVLGKWYCSYQETGPDDRKYSRYMTPKGWDIIAHWYADVADAELDFYKFGQNAREVSKIEIQNSIDAEEWYKEEWYKGAISDPYFDEYPSCIPNEL